MGDPKKKDDIEALIEALDDVPARGGGRRARPSSGSAST